MELDSNVISLNESSEAKQEIMSRAVSMPTNNQIQRRERKQRRQQKYNSARDWLADIQTRQQKFVTPEIRSQMVKRAARSQRIGKKKKRAKVYQRAACLSKNAWAQGNARSANSAPAYRVESANVSRMQMRSIQEVYQRRDFVNEEAEEEMTSVMNQLAVVQATDNIQVNESEMTKILNQMRKEPKEESEVQSKFSLYEDFLSTVEDSRKATFDFWEDCKEEFAEQSGLGNAVKSVENDLKNLDSQESLGIQFHAHRWFVYDMTVQADKNNEKIKNLLTTIEQKLELLKNDDVCPFCLDELNELDQNEIYTMSCCHKSCTDCWNNWKNLKGPNAFCPLCRQNDFLCEMAV